MDAAGEKGITLAELAEILLGGSDKAKIMRIRRQIDALRKTGVLIIKSAGQLTPSGQSYDRYRLQRTDAGLAWAAKAQQHNNTTTRVIEATEDPGKTRNTGESQVTEPGNRPPGEAR